jgi:hypothetical protein
VELLTNADLEREGIRFARESDGQLVCYGPPDRPDLYELLHAAIAWRVEAMVTRHRLAPTKRYPDTLRVLDNARGDDGQCSSCGSELPHYRAGDCELCAAARHKALQELKENK